MTVEDALSGLDAARRVGWAKYYDERRRGDALDQEADRWYIEARQEHDRAEKLRAEVMALESERTHPDERAAEVALLARRLAHERPLSEPTPLGEIIRRATNGDRP